MSLPPSRAPWEGILWDSSGARLMPAVAALDDAVASMPRLALFAACATARDAIYFLPTREWAERFSRWARSRAGGLPVLEVGSGDGFVTACLRRVAPSVEWLASDDGSWAERYPVRRERTSAPPGGHASPPRGRGRR